MDDNFEFATPGRKVPPRVAKPGEQIWQIHVNHVFWSCELRDHGRWGVEAQILRDNDFVIGLRFPSRPLAIAWADSEPADLERG